MRQRTSWLDEVDDQAISAPRDRCGCESDAAVVRLALRILVQAQRLKVELLPHPNHARRSPKKVG